MNLVTGSTGLLGSHVLVALSKENLPIRAMYRSATKKEKVKQLFHYYFQEKAEDYFHQIEWVEGDLLDLNQLKKALEHVTNVYHCAALVSFQPRDFYRLFKINREGTANLVNLMLENPSIFCCHVSSTAALGKEPEKDIDEQSKWENDGTLSGYSLSKYSAEKEVWRGIEEGLQAVIVNPSVMFGAGDWNESSLTIFRTIKKGLKFYTSGINGIVDARDVAEIMVKLIQKKVTNERYVVVGHSLPFKILFEKISQAMGVKAPSIEVKPWLMNISWRLVKFISFFKRTTPVITKHTAKTAFSQSRFSSEKIKKELNFSFRSLEDTIQNTIEGRIN